MILKALYDYYNRCGNLPAPGMEEKEIGFILVLSENGKFLRFEDCRIDNKHARTFLVKKHLGKASGTAANYLYDNCHYVLGYSGKDSSEDDKTKKRFNAFRDKVKAIHDAFPSNRDLNAIVAFYDQGQEKILEEIANDALWGKITKCLEKNIQRSHSESRETLALWPKRLNSCSLRAIMTNVLIQAYAL